MEEPVSEGVILHVCVVEEDSDGVGDNDGVKEGVLDAERDMEVVLDAEGDKEGVEEDEGDTDAEEEGDTDKEGVLDCVVVCDDDGKATKL